MRIIDGIHRLRAAEYRGDHEIAVRFFEGTDVEAFVIAVSQNIAHGLSLTLSDRRAAAARIVRSHPRWSDRAVASVTGLSPKTIGVVRQKSAVELEPDRIGSDGRVRPLDSNRGRALAGELIAGRPDASIDHIAKAAGISRNTARDVRNRMRRGESPVVQGRAAKQRRIRDFGSQEPHGPANAAHYESIVRALLGDPSLRFNAAGRTLLRLLDIRPIRGTESSRLVDNLPEHCRSLVASAAQACAAAWSEFADQLERQ
jgi:hypothetical protein